MLCSLCVSVSVLYTGGVLIGEFTISQTVVLKQIVMLLICAYLKQNLVNF